MHPLTSCHSTLLHGPPYYPCNNMSQSSYLRAFKLALTFTWTSLFTDTFMAHIPSPFNPFLQTSPSQNHALLHSLSQGWLYFLFSTQPPLKPELKDVMNYVSFAYGRTPSFYSSSRYTTELDKLFLDSINLNMAQNSDVQSI